MVTSVSRRESTARDGVPVSGGPQTKYPRTERTEDELLGRRQHVYGERHLILVDLEADPANEGGDEPQEDGHVDEVLGLVSDRELSSVVRG